MDKALSFLDVFHRLAPNSTNGKDGTTAFFNRYEIIRQGYACWVAVFVFMFRIRLNLDGDVHL